MSTLRTIARKRSMQKTRRPSIGQSPSLQLESLEQRMLLSWSLIPDAGGPYIIDEDGSSDLTLDASGTSLPNGGTIDFYQWDLDNDGYYDDAVGQQPTISAEYLSNLDFPADGQPYPVGLKVRAIKLFDSPLYREETTTAGIIINNRPPTADAGGTHNEEMDRYEYVIAEGQPLWLNGAGSTDPGNDAIVSYEWTFSEGSIIGTQTKTTTSATLYIPWDELEGWGIQGAGTSDPIKITLNVTDSDGGISVVEEDELASTTLIVNNVDPVADAGGPYMITEGEGITLKGKGSYDVNDNDELVKYKWSIGYDGNWTNVGEGKNLDLTWNQLLGWGLADDGTPLGIRLKVSDDDGGEGVEKSLVMVIQNGAPHDIDPYALPGEEGDDTYIITEGNPLQLVASAEDDGESGDDLLFLWDLDNDGVYDDAAGQYDNDPQSDNYGKYVADVPWAALEALGLPSNGTSMDIGLMVSDGEEHGVAYASPNAHLIINNAPPVPVIDVPTLFGDAYVINEGEGLWVNAARTTDPDANDEANLLYAWDIGGDGSVDFFAWHSSMAYIPWEVIEKAGVIGKDGDRVPLHLIVTDQEGGWATAEDVDLIVNNVAPVADAGGPYMINEGEGPLGPDDVVLTLDGSNSYDINANDDGDGEDLRQLEYHWEIGVFANGVVETYLPVPDGNTKTVELTWADLQGLGLEDDGTPMAVRLTVTDPDYDGEGGPGRSVDDSLVLVIQNEAPTINDHGGPYVINEGDDLVLTANASDAGEPGTELAFMWDIDGDGVFDEGAGLGDEEGNCEIVVPWAVIEHLEDLYIEYNDHMNSDGDPMDIYLMVADGEEHGFSFAATTLVINNLAPVADAGGEKECMMDPRLFGVSSDNGQQCIGIYEICEGQDLVLDASNSFDRDANDVLYYMWDLDGEGIYDFDAGTEPVVTVPWEYLESLGLQGDHNTDPTPIEIGLRVHDEEGLGQLVIDLFPDFEYSAQELADMFNAITTEFYMTVEGDGSGLLNIELLDLPQIMAAFDGSIATIEFAGDNNDLTISTGMMGVNGADVVFTYEYAYGETIYVDYYPGYQDTDKALLLICNAPPVADAGGPYVFNEDYPDDFILDGSGSYDPNANDVLTYNWTLYDADHSYSFNAGTSPIFSLNLDDIRDLWDDGTSIVVKLTVSDGDGGVDTHEDLLMVIQNVKPTVDAKLDDPDNSYVISEGQSLELNAGATDPGEPLEELMFLWDLDGDGVFDDAAGYNTVVSWANLKMLNVPTDGTPFEIGLMVYDGEEHGFGYDTATLTINNVAPSVDAGEAITINEGDVAHFYGSFTDPYGDLDGEYTYRWDFGDIPAALPAYTEHADHQYLDDTGGPFTATFYVTDKDGGIGSDTVLVTVVNLAPVVDAGDAKTSEEGEIVAFHGHFTDVGILDTHTILWDFGDGTDPVAGTLDPTHTYADDGTYTVTLTVTDDDGGVGTDTFTMIVFNKGPWVYAGKDMGLDEGDTVTFDLADYSDVWADENGDTPPPDAPPSIHWDFSRNGNVYYSVDGVLNPTHTFMDDGLYVARLTVDDHDGGVVFDEVTIYVENVAPVVVANVPDEDMIEKDTYYTFSGSIYDPGILDTHTIIWDFGDGYMDKSGTLTPSHKYTESGVYTVSLIVHDNDGAHDIDLMQMTVYEELPIFSNFVAHYGVNGLVTAKLYGPGTLESVRYIAGIGLDFSSMTLSETTEKSKLAITARGGHRSIADLATVGDIMVNDGSLGNLSAYRMNLRGSLQAPAGSLGNVQFGALDWESSIMTGFGDIGMLSVKYDIEGVVSSSGSIGKVMSTRGGLTDTGALLANNGSINAVRLISDIDGMLMASNSINSVTSLRGELTGTIRAGDEIGKVSFANIDSAMISAGGNIKSVSSKKDIVDSYVLAAYDIGADGLMGTLDDVFNPNGSAINSIRVNPKEGKFDGTFAMAGVEPYDAASMTMLASDPGMQTIASFGQIKSATVGRVFFNGDPMTGIYGLFAATEPIDNLKYVDDALASGAPDFEASSTWY